MHRVRTLKGKRISLVRADADDLDDWMIGSLEENNVAEQHGRRSCRGQLHFVG